MCRFGWTEEEVGNRMLKDVLAMEMGDLGQVSDVCHSIETGDNVPVCQLPRRVPFFLRPEVAKLIE